jgi:hypothetical protein
MATLSVTNAVAGVPVGRKLQVVEVMADFSTTNLTTADTFQALSIPANTLVVAAGVEVVTVTANAGCVLDMGDSDDDLYVSALDATTAGHEINNAAGTMKLYTAADTIDLTVDTATFDGKARVFAVICDMGSGETAISSFTSA